MPFTAGPSPPRRLCRFSPSPAQEPLHGPEVPSSRGVADLQAGKRQQENKAVGRSGIFVLLSPEPERSGEVPLAALESPPEGFGLQGGRSAESQLSTGDTKRSLKSRLIQERSLSV